MTYESYFIFIINLIKSGRSAATVTKSMSLFIYNQDAGNYVYYIHQFNILFIIWCISIIHNKSPINPIP